MPGLQGRGLGAFHDIDLLTMFADYRVPVVLRQLDILQYSSQLASKVHHIQQCHSHPFTLCISVYLHALGSVMVPSSVQYSRIG